MFNTSIFSKRSLSKPKGFRATKPDTSFKTTDYEQFVFDLNNQLTASKSKTPKSIEKSKYWIQIENKP